MKKRLCACDCIRSIGIIGGGMAGLIALAECCQHLESVSPVLYEQSPYLGGLWSQQPDLPGVLQSTLFNTSAAISSIESTITLFEYMQKKYNGSKNFPTSKDFIHYLQEWIREANLQPFIQLNSFITNVHSSNQCKIQGYRKGLNETSTKHEAFEAQHDFLFICTGLNNKFLIPSWCSQDFPVEEPPLYHTGQNVPYNGILRKSEEEVLVVGGGASGVEAIVNLIEQSDAKPIIHWIPTRHRNSRNAWIFDRYRNNQTDTRPNDEKISAIISYIPSLMSFIQGFIAYPLHRKQLLTWSGKYDIYGVGDISAIKAARNSGQLKVFTADVQHINIIMENEKPRWFVKFKDDTDLTVCKIILATGYLQETPFLPNTNNLSQSLYNDVLGTKSEHWRCAFIGFRRISGASAPILQMTTRWTLKQWLSGNCTSEEDRLKLCGRVGTQATQNLFINPLIRCEKLAHEIGETPSRFLKLFHYKREERLLGIVLLFGPWSCVQYALKRDKTRWSKYLINLFIVSRGQSTLNSLMFAWDSIFTCLLLSIVFIFFQQFILLLF